jgi:hypothetical protein
VAGLSGLQTAGALAAVVTSLGVALVRPEVLALLSIPLGAVLALVVVRIRGESLAGLLERRARMLVSTGVLHLTVRTAAGGTGRSAGDRGDGCQWS